MFSALPNILTVLRIFMTFLFGYYLLQSGFTAKVVAAGIFLIASITDFLDGYLARKYALITGFGKIMDPIADKFIMLTAFYIFYHFHLIALWMFVLIFIREVGMTSWRLIAIRQGKVMAAEKAGKWKTVTQFVAVYLILLYLILVETNLFSQWPQEAVRGYIAFINGIMLFVVGITVYSGLSYVVQNRKVTHG